MAANRVLKAVKFLRERMRADGLRIAKVVLFGSHARGTPTEDSDVDVAIVSDDFKGRDIFERAHMTKNAEIEAIRKFLLPFDIVTLTTSEFSKGTSLLAQFARQGREL